MTCRRATKLQEAGASRYLLGSIKNHSTKAQGLAFSLTKSYPNTNTLKNMLRAKDMITKLLDGLEMFLDVGVMFLNSSNSKMTGGSHIYRPPSP